MAVSLSRHVAFAFLLAMLLQVSVAAQDKPESSSESSAADVASQQEEDDTDSQQSDDDSESSKDEDSESGQADLDAAFDLKINAKSTRDLDSVADLCESAIEKGLDAVAEKQARNLWGSVLYDHAKQLQRRIAPGGTLSTRWRWLRREAISRLNKSIEVDPGKVDALILLAQLHSLNTGDKDKAKEAIEKAIALIKGDNEKLSSALFTRSRLAEDPKARMADLTQAVKINPQNFEALMERAMVNLVDDKNDEAFKDFQAALKINKENVDRFLVVANELRRRSMFVEAVEILNDAAKVEPENVKLLLLRSRCLAGAEDETAALADLNKALEIDRQNVEALEFRTRILIAESKFEEALADASELIQQLPDKAVGLELRSLVHQAAGDLDKAIEDTQELLKRDEDNLNFKFNLAILFSANNQPSKSIPVFDEILRNVSEAGQPSILRNRGDAYLSLGEHERAIDDYEMALDVFEELQSKSEEPDELSQRQKEIKSGLLNNLAWVLATSPEDDLRDGDKAVELATEASELTDYKAAFILSTLASGYAENGDFETAKKWASKAVELAEDDEQRVGLKEELDSYEQEKPWREKEDVETEKKKDDSEQSADEAKGDDDDKSESESDPKPANKDAKNPEADKDGQPNEDDSDDEKSDGAKIG